MNILEYYHLYIGYKVFYEPVLQSSISEKYSSSYNGELWSILKYKDKSSCAKCGASTTKSKHDIQLFEEYFYDYVMSESIYVHRI